MDKLRVAMLGLEHPHCDFWQVAFRESDASELVGIWSATPGLAAEKAARYGCEALENRAALIDDCDAVAICSPTVQHPELIEAAARAGKKILCEKPVAGTFEDCRRVESILGETGAYYMQGFPKRFDPVNHEIARIVRGGELGTVFLVRVRHGHPFAAINPDFSRGWFASPSEGGGGALLDEGVHAADFIRWLFGDPATVSCTMNHIPKGLEVEETGTAVFQYADGMIAEITSSWHFLAADNSVEIYGSNGSIVLSGVDLGSRDLSAGGYLKCYKSDGGLSVSTMGQRSWAVAPVVPQFKRDTGVFHGNVARAFVQCAVNDEPPPVTLDDGLRAARMILSAYRAARSAKTEPVVLD